MIVIEPTEAQVAQRVKAKRDQLLKESDPMALPDYPHPDDTTRQRWLDYRQALRDVSQQEGFPFNINWPVKPE
jgi:hypothetical protein